ncbi:branched-chain amino acid ABC transporter permease [Variovorax humicola]|uniref:Branched-chain amino acid ABC transporter permease n=1 Tax=Variovorax humicola TaxID=1769758 RepID=A0ABU8W988_9BURK
MDQLLPLVISGFVSGAAYGLVALGKVIIFKTTDTVNFALADIATLAAFVAITGIGHGLPVPAALVLAVVVAGLLGIATQRWLVRRLVRDRNRIFVALVLMIGLGLVIRALIGQVWGHEPVPFPALVAGTVRVGGIELAWNKIVATGFALAAMAFVAWFFNRTAFGVAMRACADDPFAAKLIGIDAERVAMIAWFIGCALAAIAIFFLAGNAALSTTFALVPLFRALAGVFLGGLTSMPGAVVGGFVVGILDNLAAGYVSASFRDTIVFAIIVVVLFVRPAGFLGKVRAERV